ncbi:DUF1298 domain-containing protein [Gordonia jinghuaiqii]|uniref:DUF1298 domain-containing protein n=1 Tax=Gordonia jinghuaiqii TaxID=2758710 RepID=A0A7D7QVA6_9ACTN|nr:WS/DGAT domain-containing protein [Gordonia jinghuaiqii]MCR5976929.1 DUF1298 domain-containing protein [Gordonia jinghuaiqii]QMT00449.1 DUF1298 domain-containing protein [Gordonia jinghuaiqii]
MHRMAADDAASYWMAQRIPDDQFLLYCFAAPDVSLGECGERLLRRASRVDDLCLRVHDVPASADRPYWIAAHPSSGQVRVDPTMRTWSSCLERVADLIDEPLVPSAAAWRLHLFGPVTGAPRSTGPVVVVVLQISHALADGRRASQIARELFAASAVEKSRPRSRMPGILRDVVTFTGGVLRFPGEFLTTARRGVTAARAQRQGDPPRPGFALTTLNRPAGRRRMLRVIVVDRAALTRGGRSVTAGALTAISVALPHYLGTSPGRLGVELTIGRSGKPHARNHFRNAGIDLHTEVDDLDERAHRIGAEIDRARVLEADPVQIAQRRASQATPAILTHWGIRSFDLDIQPESVTGVTVVSSVNHGAPDMDLDGGEILFTAGFPSLSPLQGLTHGVHGIGDRVAVSVTTGPDVMGDVDRYVEILTRALRA